MTARSIICDIHIRLCRTCDEYFDIKQFHQRGMNAWRHNHCCHCRNKKRKEDREKVKHQKLNKIISMKW